MGWVISTTDHLGLSPAVLVFPHALAWFSPTASWPGLLGWSGWGKCLSADRPPIPPLTHPPAGGIDIVAQPVLDRPPVLAVCLSLTWGDFDLRAPL
jgi:hypothetical protein